MHRRVQMIIGEICDMDYHKALHIYKCQDRDTYSRAAGMVESVSWNINQVNTGMWYHI